MPVAPTYPGVYVEELPSGVHTITGVSTAVTAFLGYFSQGPMNQATQIFSVADLERTFGSLTAQQRGRLRHSAVLCQRRGRGVGGPGGRGPAGRVHAPAAPQTAGIHARGRTVRHSDLAGHRGQPGQLGQQRPAGRGLQHPGPYGGLQPHRHPGGLKHPAGRPDTEVYRNLTLDPTSPNYAVAVVNNASALVQLALVGTPAATDLPAPTGTVGANVDTSA